LEKYNKIKVIERITEIQSNNSIDKWPSVPIYWNQIFMCIGHTH
jgi:hypothetical protein